MGWLKNLEERQYHKKHLEDVKKGAQWWKKQEALIRREQYEGTESYKAKKWKEEILKNEKPPERD